MNSRRSDTEKINLIKEGKKIGIDDVIKHNEIINKSLNLKYKNMSSYCCFQSVEKIQKVYIQEF